MYNDYEEDRKDKLRAVKKALIAFALLCLFVVCMVLIMEIIFDDASTTTQTDDTAALNDTEQASDDYDELSDYAELNGITNILLIGQDTRVPGERARSDSMIIVSINADTGEVNLISLMRDMYVDIPGYKGNRINAAYRYGGAELLDEVILENFGVEIDFNVEIDFDSFETIIYLVGGVDITLTAEEAEYFQSHGYDYVVQGVNHADGDLALAYSRTRYVSTAAESDDFGRTWRQREIIAGIFKAYKNVDTSLKVITLKQTYNLVDTDMDVSDLISALRTVQNMQLDSIGSYRLPADGSYTNQTIRGMMVLVPDVQANAQILREIIAGEYEISE